MAPRASAVIFDMDGVLVDSEPLWRVAEVETFAAFGIVLTPEQSEATLGLRIDDVVNLVVGERQDVDRHAVGQATLARMRELIAREGKALPGAKAAVDRAGARGLKVGLASSSPRSLIDVVLMRLGLEGAFEAVHSAEDEPFGKPHPAVYLSAAARLGVAPARCIAIEDSLRGVIAAKAASMRCVAVPAKADARFAVADVVLSSLTELNDEVWGKLSSLA
ncbi:MAG: hexitol phosphatase HxpB [Myxococcales bacterium]|nr:hexitol phosphatase HxpB [Myxococcales bacterium]